MKAVKNQRIHKINTIVAFSILTLFFMSQLFGQNPPHTAVNFCKPNGTAAAGTVIMEEMSQSEIITKTQDFMNTYPHFEVLAPASSRYNCFGYAFFVTENSDTAVVGYTHGADAVIRFSRDHSPVGVSFIEVPENQNPDKAILIDRGCSNPNGTTTSHAAVTCNDPTKLISKSGFLPLYKHPKDADIPGPNGIGISGVGSVHCYKYYKRNYSINLDGPNLVRGNGTFIVDTTHASFTQISWQAEPAHIFQSATGNGKIADLRVKPSLSSLPIIGSITFYLGHGCDNTYRITKNFMLQRCPIANFVARIVNTNQTFTACDIYSKNVTVTRNVKLILNAVNQTIIERDFEVQLGAELEIR